MPPKKTALEEKVEDHSRKIDRMDTLLAGVVGKVNKIELAVTGDGNGNIGMGERLRDITKELGDMKQDIAKELGDMKQIEVDRKASREKWTYGVVMVFVAQLIAMGFSAFMWFARILPVLESIEP